MWRTSFIAALALLAACSAPERAPPPKKVSKPTKPAAAAPADADWPEPVGEIRSYGTAPASRERPKARPVDAERVAELTADIHAERADYRSGRRPPGPRPPRPVPDEDFSHLDLDGLVELLRTSIREADEIQPIAPGEDLVAREAGLTRLERRLRSVAYRLQLRQDEQLRAWERQLAEEDLPLAQEEERLSRRSLVAVTGAFGTYYGVYDVREELADVREERRQLKADYERRVRELEGAYRPLIDGAAAARSSVGTWQREVQRARAELSSGDE